MKQDEDPLEFIDGEFVRNSIMVKPLFGDLDQIELVRQVNAVKEAVASGSYSLYCWELASGYEVFFRCLCGRRKTIEVKECVEEKPGFTIVGPEAKVKVACQCGKRWVGKHDGEFHYKFTIK